MVEVKIERTHPNAKMPTKATPGSACWDVYAAEDAKVMFGAITIVSLGFKMEIPAGYEIVVRPRSGLMFKEGITCHLGTIDEDYRGDMKIALTSFNSNHEIYLAGCCEDKVTHDWRFPIIAGDRIAQIALKKVEDYVFVEGKVDDDTIRGAAGFGSTGK